MTVWVADFFNRMDRSFRQPHQSAGWSRVSSEAPRFKKSAVEQSFSKESALNESKPALKRHSNRPQNPVSGRDAPSKCHLKRFRVAFPCGFALIERRFLRKALFYSRFLEPCASLETLDQPAPWEESRFYGGGLCGLIGVYTDYCRQRQVASTDRGRDWRELRERFR